MKFIQLTFPECFALLLSLTMIWAELCEVLVSRTSAGRRQGYCIINVGINLWIHPFVIILSSPSQGLCVEFWPGLAPTWIAKRVWKWTLVWFDQNSPTAILESNNILKSAVSTCWFWRSSWSCFCYWLYVETNLRQQFLVGQDPELSIQPT